MRTPIPFATEPPKRVALLRSTTLSARETRSSAQFWQPLVLRDMSVVCADVTLDSVDTHAHEALLIVVAFGPIFAGDGTGHELRLEDGSLLVVPPGSPVTLRRASPSQTQIGLLLIAPRGAAAQSALEPSTSRLADNQVIEDRALHLTAVALLDELREPERNSAQGDRLRELLADVRAAVAAEEHGNASRVRRAPRGVRKLNAMLREDPTRSTSLEGLADAASLSKFYLLRSFKREYGLTPHAYQMQLRLARARRLIEKGRSLSFAANDAGLADQSHLTRRFRDYFGLTPAAYARQVSRSARVVDATQNAA
jgi:AraC-like DNA-binding protein